MITEKTQQQRALALYERKYDASSHRSLVTLRLYRITTAARYKSGSSCGLWSRKIRTTTIALVRVGNYE